MLTLQMSRRLACVLLGLAVWSVHSPLHAAPASELKMSTEKIVVYKDGFALVIKQAIGVTDENGQLYTKDVPDAAVLGSFWAIPKAGTLKNMVAGWETFSEQESQEVPATTQQEILQANVGKEAKIVLSPEVTLTGTILSVPVTRATTVVNDDAFQLLTRRGAAQAPQASTTGNITRTITQETATHFILKTETGEAFVPIAQIQRMTIAKMQTKLKKTVTVKNRSKRLRFQFEKPGQKREMTIMYFRPGLRWIPTYRVALNEKPAGTTEMALQGELLNEAEDFGETPVDLVVGVPNFRFRETVSPLVLERTLLRTLRQAAPQIMGNYRNDFNNGQIMMSNSLFTQRAGEMRRPGGTGGAATGGELNLPKELTTGSKQDLFVYHLPKIDLKKGERATVPIFNADDLPVSDVYTWSIQLKRSDIETAPSGSGNASPLKLSKNQVWHQMDLTNVTKVPWTTGAAMILDGSLPIAQELLTYTSVGSEVRIPMTVAIDVRGSVDEKEVARDLNALTWDRSVYAKVTKQATVTITNHKETNITAEIEMQFGGKATEATNKGEISLGAYRSQDWENYRGHPAVNNSSTVRWRVTLKPGETLNPQVTYHYYTRR